MADHLGVIFNEKDLSKSASALPVPAGVMAVYSIKGPTDKGYLCRSEDDIRRIFGQPQAEMRDGALYAGTVFDLNRGLQNAFRFVRTGLPLYISRAIPAAAFTKGYQIGATYTGRALINFQKDSSGASPITAIAKGHGEFYGTTGVAGAGGLAVVIKGIESVQRLVTLPFSSGVTHEVDLQDCVLPGTLVVEDPDKPGSAGDQATDIGTAYGVDVSEAAVMSRTLTLLGVALTVTYEKSATVKSTTMIATGLGSTKTVRVSYERTTSERVVRLFICDNGETDPINNNYENYLVSLKESGKDEAGKACYIEDVVNGTSELIDIVVSGSYDQTTIPLSSSATAYTGNLLDGENGVYARTDAEIVTALQFFRNRVAYDFLYCFDAGYADNVKTELCNIAAMANRPFATAYIDPDYSIFMSALNKAKTGTALGTESQVVDKVCNWRMSIGNKEFGILAGSTWGLISDEFNGGRKLWMPPTWAVGAAAITVDNTLGSWNSVAGPRRGVLDFEKLVINLYSYVDLLNAKQCNPIVIDERGIMQYYGNKTLKIVASAMQQAHARKTRGRISREFFWTALDYMFENLVGSTFNSIRDDFEQILESYGEALESYSLVVMPTDTLADDLNKQILRIKVGLIFNQIAEEINITTTVFRNSSDLSVEVA